MTKRNMIISLILPVFIIILSVTMLFATGLQSPLNPFIWTSVASLVCGGVLPVLLTVFCKIDTSMHIKDRLISFGASAATGVFVCFALAFFWNVVFLIFLLFPLIISTLHFHFREEKLSRKIVIFLSDPMLYVIITVVIFLISLANV